MIGRTIGRFRIESKLGQGGMAKVWKARDTLLGRPVALKILNDDLADSERARRRFVHEAQAASLLDHPGIAAVYDAGEQDGHAYIAFAYVDGETLTDRVARSLLPIEQAARVVCAAALALAHAHERGVVHRDVTGRNVMIARNGRVVLLDFGLSLAAGMTRLTSTGVQMGTTPYMAPEALTQHTPDERADIYGLGVVLYEALTGTFPFTGETRDAVLYRAQHEAAAPPSALRPDVPPALDAVVSKALARDPAQRYQTAADFAAALERVSAELPQSPDDALGHDAPLATETEWTSAPAEPFVVQDEIATQTYHAARAGPMYLAVVPFADASESADADGSRHAFISELALLLRSELATVPDVRLVSADGHASLPAASAAALRGTARSLGANCILGGTIRRSGTQLRVTYSLFDAVRGVDLAGESIDGSAFDLRELGERVVASARRALERATARTPEGRTRREDPAARDHLAQALRYLRRHDNEASIDGAIALLERLPPADAATAPVQATLARAYLLKNKLSGQRHWEAQAARACQRAIELDAAASETQTAQGLLLAASGEHERAIECFENALAAAPEDIGALLGYADSCALRGRHEDAERACREAMRLDPNDWRPWGALGVFLYTRGQYREALPLMERVAQLRPDNPWGYMNVGSVLYRLDRFDESIASYHRSVDVQPTAHAYSSLGTVLFFLGRYEEALQPFERAAGLSPLDPLVLGNLGCAYRFVSGHEADAVRTLERAIDLVRETPEHADAVPALWARTANWLTSLGRNAEAQEAIDRALRLAPDDVACLADAGRAYSQMGDRDRAIRYLRSAIDRGYGAEALRRDPELMELRKNPEFQSLLGSAKADRARSV